MRDLLAGFGVCLLVAAVLAFVYALAWDRSRPPQQRGRTGRLLIDIGLGLTAAGAIVAVAGLIPIRSAGSPETLPTATTLPGATEAPAGSGVSGPAQAARPGDAVTVAPAAPR